MFAECFGRSENARFLNVSSAKATTKATAFLLTEAKKVGKPASTPSEQSKAFYCRFSNC
jgi:hypothetical protein